MTADKSLFRNYLKELKKIRLDFEKRLQDIGTTAIGIISDAGLKTSDFKNGATSGCNFFNKMAEKKWNKNIVEPPKARFTSLEDEENNWFVKTSPHRAAILSIYPSLNPLVKETLHLFNTEYKTYMTAVETSKYLYALGILIDIDKRIEDYEKEHNILLLSDTSEILNSIINENDTPFIYEKTGTQIDHFMIDEFQDTSRLQWKNFAPLIHESQSHNRDNMIVGDVKQSIYRWRNSDWKLLNNELSQEFSPSQRVDKVMDTNWRSCANIIRFNNAFFYNAASRLQNNLTEIIDPKEKNFPAITDAYADIYQNTPSKKRNNEGYVELKMLADSSENSYQENVLQRIPDILKELQDRGRKLKDIAFLVRTGNQGKQIVDLLLDLNAKNTDDKYRFDVISNESLLLKNAPVIKLITGFYNIFRIQITN
ncbi:MAG: UvrD-helicase domain-containing protein [Barnesiella sp.]